MTTAKRTFKLRFVVRLDLPFRQSGLTIESWARSQNNFSTEVRTFFALAQHDEPDESEGVSTTAVEWLGGTSVDTEVTVDDLEIATHQFSELRRQANTGSLTLGGSAVVSVSAALNMDSLGDAITAISPNIGFTANDAITTITIHGEARTAFDSSTRISAGGSEPRPTTPCFVW